MVIKDEDVVEIKDPAEVMGVARLLMMVRGAVGMAHAMKRDLGWFERTDGQMIPIRFDFIVATSCALSFEDRFPSELTRAAFAINDELVPFSEITRRDVVVGVAPNGGGQVVAQLPNTKVN